MHQNDLLRLQTCNAKELERVAESYGIAPTGPRMIYGIRRQAQNPFTRTQHVLKRSLHTTDLRSALVKGIPVVDEWLTKIKSERAPVLTTGAEKLATVEELVTAYHAATLVKANDATQKRNVQSLWAVLRVAHGSISEASSSALICWEAADLFQRARKAAAEREPNLLKRDAMLRSANNTLKQAQSVVCRAALDGMRHLRLNLEGCRAFNERSPLPVDAPPEPVPLTDEQVAMIRAAAEALRGGEVEVVISGKDAERVRVKVPGASVWAAFQLMVWGGVRNIEAANARWSWVKQDGAVWRLHLTKTETWKPKGGGRVVPLPTAVVDELKALKRPEGDDHIVPARTVTERTQVCWRAVNVWLGGLGVDREAGKVAYRLRKYFLNRVKDETMRQMEAIAAAANAGGHANVETTMTNYVGRPTLRAPVSLPGEAFGPGANKKGAPDIGAPGAGG